MPPMQQEMLPSGTQFPDMRASEGFFDFAETARLGLMLHVPIADFFINIAIDYIRIRAAPTPNELTRKEFFKKCSNRTIFYDW